MKAVHQESVSQSFNANHLTRVIQDIRKDIEAGRLIAALGTLDQGWEIFANAEPSFEAEHNKLCQAIRDGQVQSIVIPMYARPLWVLADLLEALRHGDPERALASLSYFETTEVFTAEVGDVYELTRDIYNIKKNGKPGAVKYEKGNRFVCRWADAAHGPVELVKVSDGKGWLMATSPDWGEVTARPGARHARCEVDAQVHGF